MGRRQTARCRGCRGPVVFFRSPFTSRLRTFDPTPVDGNHPLAGASAFPVMGLSAFKPADLVEVLQVQRGCSDVEAAEEIRDIPWHLLHQCTDPETEQQLDQPESKETHPS